jgi:hypothetical protein
LGSAEPVPPKQRGRDKPAAALAHDGEVAP